MAQHWSRPEEVRLCPAFGSVLIPVFIGDIVFRNLFRLDFRNVSVWSILHGIDRFGFKRLLF